MSAADFDLQADVHRRKNLLTGDSVLVSPHRAARPWQGLMEPPAPSPAHAYEPDCYLCPGNARAAGSVNPRYAATFVFDNDFPALRPESRIAHFNEGNLLIAHSEAGRCRVICYSPLHNLSLGQLPAAGVAQVIDTWTEEYLNLGADPSIAAVTIFENRGPMMGASNPHPHGQIWANETVPDEQVKESAAQQGYLQQRGSCLLCDYAALESQRKERVVCANEQFIAVVPF